MKRGKDVRDSSGQTIKPEAPKEVPVLMFVMVEKAPAISLSYASLPITSMKPYLFRALALLLLCVPALSQTTPNLVSSTLRI
jgi:hypothetical protein